ncbi:unnamed protein product, partial [Oppiella nova]
VTAAEPEAPVWSGCVGDSGDLPPQQLHNYLHYECDSLKVISFTIMSEWDRGTGITALAHYIKRERKLKDQGIDWYATDQKGDTNRIDTIGQGSLWRTISAFIRLTVQAFKKHRCQY